MHNTKSFFKFIQLICLLVFLYACDKEEVIDTCQDGIFTPGEEGVDCGGPCPPCEEEISSLAFATINGFETRFDDYSIEKFDDWVIRIFNDTIDITLNLGNGDSLGLRPMKPLFSKAQLFNKNFSQLAQGRTVFMEIDHDEQRLSFYCDAKFTLDPSGPNFNPLDTLFITQGDFANIPWENQ